MKNIKKILIVNAHSVDNKGDEGIILSMLDSIKEKAENAEIAISSRYWKQDEPYYSAMGIETLPQIFEYPEHALGTPKRLAFLIKELIYIHLQRFSNKSLSGSKKRLIEWYRESDLVVSCGGGFLLSNHPQLIEPSLLSHYYQLKYALWKKKQVLIYSQTIGPFKSKMSTNWFSKLLSKVSHIYVRENFSQQILRKMGVLHAKVVADSAFSLESKASPIAIDQDDKVIGVTLRQWKFPDMKEPVKLYEKYLKSVATAISSLHEKNYKVMLIPQVTGPTPYEDDRLANRDLLKYLPEKDRQLLLNLDSTTLHAKQMKDVYSKLYGLLGTRMHSNIFALSSLVPVIAISYETKTRGIMEKLNLGEYSINIEDVTSEDLLRIVDNFLEKYNTYKIHLSKEIPEVINDAKRPAETIKTILAQTAKDE